jgi:hypothetical protein
MSDYSGGRSCTRWHMRERVDLKSPVRECRPPGSVRGHRATGVPTSTCRCTAGTLTPALLLPAPRQVSLIIERAFPDIPSPTTPCAPVLRRCSLFRAGLATASLSVASGGSSDFDLHLRTLIFTSSLVIRIRPYRVCVAGHFGPSVLRTVLSFPVALHALSPGRCYFPLVAGSTATEGLPPSHARSFSSALAAGAFADCFPSSNRE